MQLWCTEVPRLFVGVAGSAAGLFCDMLPLDRVSILLHIKRNDLHGWRWEHSTGLGIGQALG